MFNNVLDRKETFFGEKNSIFQSPKQLKNGIFFSLFPFGLILTENK